MLLKKKIFQNDNIREIYKLEIRSLASMETNKAVSKQTISTNVR